MTQIYLRDATPNLAKAYISTKGNFCPYCGSNSISARGSHTSDPYSFIIDCHDCERSWLEVLEIVALLLDEGVKDVSKS